MEKEIKKGDSVYIEQCWEDEVGNYHDEVARVYWVRDGQARLVFSHKNLNAWFKGQTWPVEELELVSSKIPSDV